MIINSRSPLTCKNHVCKVNNCNKQQVYPYLGFCQIHVCIHCATTKNTNRHCPRVNEKALLCEEHKCKVIGCNRRRLDEYNGCEFCELHLCRVCIRKVADGGFNKLSGVDLKCPHSQLCQIHRCTFKNTCSKQRFEPALFCSEHSCKECVALKCAIINPTSKKAPRNSCTVHPLCEFVSHKGITLNIYLFFLITEIRNWLRDKTNYVVLIRNRYFIYVTLTSNLFILMTVFLGLSRVSNKSKNQNDTFRFNFKLFKCKFVMK